MAITADGLAPYGSPSAILAVIHHHREKRFRGAIDSKVLGRAGIATSNAAAQRTIQTLRLLDLTDDDGNPSTALNGLAEATEEEFEDRFQAVLRQAYAPVFEVAEPSDGYTRVRDAFRSNTPAAQQKRMVSLFLNLCAAAGMVEEVPQPSSTKRTASSTSTKGRIGESSGSKKPPPPPHEPWMTKFPTIAGIMEKLPMNGHWTQDERDAFYDIFGTLLDFEIDVDEDEEVPEEQNG